MHNLRYSFWILLLISFVAYAHAHPNIAKPEDEIRQRSATWNTAFAARDTAKLLTILAGDVHIVTGGGKCQTLEGAQRFFNGLFKLRPDLKWSNEPTEIKINLGWELAYEEGNWTEGWTESDGRTLIQGKYFALWKQSQGSWFLHAVIFVPLSCTGSSQYCKAH